MRLQERFDAATLRYRVAVRKILEFIYKIYDKFHEVNISGSNKGLEECMILLANI